jgi:hypothetical protein
MPALYLYRDSDELPEPTTSDLASKAARRDYAQRYVRALEAAALDDQAFVTTTATWRAYLTLASMFDANTFLTRVLVRALADSASSASIDDAVATALGEAWSRADECGPLIPTLTPDTPLPVNVVTGDPHADAEYQVVLDAVLHASEPGRRQDLRRLYAFAHDGGFLVDTDPGATRIRQEQSPAG